MGLYGDCKMNNGKKIKICFIAPKAYPIFNPKVGTYFGGAEVDLYYLATELAKDNAFEVSFIVADYRQNDVETIEGVTVLKSLDFRKNVFDGLLRTWRALKQADADIYFLKCASPGVPLAVMFCKLHRRICLYRLASLLESNGTYVRQHPVLGRLFAWSLRRAELVFAQNAIDTENLTRTMGISSHVIPNGHPLPQMQQQRRDTILWVGRDDTIKKPWLFLDLAEAVPSEHFTMVCQTLNNDQNYSNLVARAGKIQNLQFIRHAPFNKIDAYFQRTKVFVNTSDAEGFPNTFIQACKCGTAILSFKVNPDGFLDKFGCGVNCDGDQGKMVDSLRDLLIGEKYLELGKRARKYAEQNHDIKKIIEEYKKIFRQKIISKTQDLGLKTDTAERFAFGKNWRDFCGRLQHEDYLAAKESLKKLTPDLQGKTFLDVGCGSGLFSIAASALGAKKVLGFDFDENSISTSRKMLDTVSQWDGDVKKDKIEFKVESILNENINLGQYDVVYSWGVLHHTGNMYAAFDYVKNLVAEKGTLVLAIYNKHFTSPIWKLVKHTYVKSPKLIKKILIFMILIIKFPWVLIILRQNPFKKERGMHFYTDIVDWVGGYPYEYASVSEVADFFQARGFRLTKLTKTKGFTGCNEFVFEKVQ